MSVPLYLVPIFIIGILVFVIYKNKKEWKYNNSKPVLCSSARVVSKTIEHDESTDEMPTTTTYYVTFELQGGECKSFHVKMKDYRIIAEGDNGVLCSQGTRFRGFARNM